MEFDTLGEDTALAAISTFSGGGIGDLGIEYGCGVPVISACEIVPDRARLIRHNYRNTRIHTGDIWEMVGEICDHSLKTLDKRSPWLVVLSPPCQGMSSNGAGRISNAIRKGNRPKEDERNRLVIPGVLILEWLKPDWFILENVRRMENTVITNEHGEPENILDLLARRLHPLGYTIRSAIIDFRDLGVPHHRRRLITIGCRLPHIVEDTIPGKVFHDSPTELHPIRTHGGERQPPHITMRRAIGHMPELDAKEGGDKWIDPEDVYHIVPEWNEKHYSWMSATPEGKSAFDNNECTECGISDHDVEDVKCLRCGVPLPKPQISESFWKCDGCDAEYLIKGGKPPETSEGCNCKSGSTEAPEILHQTRLIRGFRTSYRRLKWDEPASTITQNSGVISSDMKGHPDQNRVLSIREIMILSTIDSLPEEEPYQWQGKYEFKERFDTAWPVYGDRLNRDPRLVRQVIGESIPPLAMARIVGHLMDIDGRIEGYPTLPPEKAWNRPH